MKVFVGSDHAGFARKGALVKALEDMGQAVVDLGTHSEDSADYPIFGQAVGRAVAAEEGTLGVVTCGSGVGISIAANKVQGVRCVLCADVQTVRQAREHGGINVLALAGRGDDLPELKPMLEAFFETKVDETERHARRRNQLDAMKGE